MTTLRVRPTRSRDDSATDPRSTDWGAVLASISEGALQREVDGALPVEAVQLLKAKGFGALRVPSAYGAPLQFGALTPLLRDFVIRAGQLAGELKIKPLRERT